MQAMTSWIRIATNRCSGKYIGGICSYLSVLRGKQSNVPFFLQGFFSHVASCPLESFLFLSFPLNILNLITVIQYVFLKCFFFFVCVCYCCCCRFCYLNKGGTTNKYSFLFLSFDFGVEHNQVCLRHSFTPKIKYGTKG